VERNTTTSPSPLTCKGPDEVSYPVYRLVELAEAAEPPGSGLITPEGPTAPADRG